MLETNNIKILLVEDNKEMLNEVVSSLREDYFYQFIDTATSSGSAIEKINEQYYEIIVADMRLSAENEGGFIVLEEIKKRNISSMVIIFTANDTVSDCRKAFKSEAWDYISKNDGDVIEELHNSIQNALKYLNRWGNRKDEQWIKENEELLKTQYLGKYIAVLNHMVIESATTENELKASLKERKLPLFLPVIRQIGMSILDIIAGGENDTVEFKSTLKWDVIKNQKNEELKYSTLKTIAAFLNSKGGLLILGVEDNGNIYGLEKDMESIQKKDKDGLELHLRDLIKQFIGEPFSPKISIQFEIAQDKWIALIHVAKSNEFAFLKESKNTERQFYIRSGNRSSSLNVEEFYNYQKQRT